MVCPYGLWEAPDGQGGAVGLPVLLTTTVPADVATLSGGDTRLDSIKQGDRLTLMARIDPAGWEFLLRELRDVSGSSGFAAA